MFLKKCLYILFFAIGTLGFSQQIELSPLTKVSILTVGTADELHSKFGHSAIRIQDPTIGLDIVYNYGVFDFNDPNFYVKFTRGKLLYRLGIQKMDNFMRTYKIENRWVKEQVLKLSAPQRAALFKFLQNNYLPENRSYKYDFLFDNCSTRVPDAFKKVLGEDLELDYTHLKEHYTFRQLIHQNLEVNSWSNFGIDLALGSVIDREATSWEHMFLPIYVFRQMPHATVNGQPLVFSESELLAERPVEKNSNFLLSPLFWLSIVTLIVLAVTYFDFKNHKRSRWLDFTLFFMTGAAGLLILFLWFGTDHQATKLNFNALWAFMPNMAVAFVLLRKQLPPWIKKYLWILLGLLALTALLWLFKVQIFSPLIMLLLLALAIRYLFLSRSLA